MNLNIFNRTLRTYLLEFSGLIFLAGITASRDSFTPQRVIDGGLLYSGQIQYESDSFMYKVLTDSFTLLHPLAGLLLSLGIGILKVGFIFQFTNLLVLAFSTFYILKSLKFNTIYSITIVTILVFSIPKITQILTRNYNTLVNSEHTYGQYGLTFSILVTCLLLRKKYFSLGIVFPIFLSIHIGWATFMIAIIFSTIISMQWERKTFHYRNFGIGFVISSILLIPVILPSSFKFRSSFYTIKLTDYRQFYKIYVDNWDYHRSFSFSYGVLLTNLSLFILILITLISRKKIHTTSKLFLILISYGIILSSTLYVLNDKILKNNNIPLSSLMPSRFFNFQAFLSIIILSVMIQLFYNHFKTHFKFNSISATTERLTLIGLFAFFAFYIFNPAFGTNTNFNFRPVSFFERVNFSGVCNYLGGEGEKILTLTYGNISRFVPLFCHQPILIDTTQIDFAPYLPETIPSLSQIMEEIYGIPFANKEKLNSLYRNDLNPWYNPKGPSGSIDPIYQETLWSLRSETRWQYLSCQYGFNKIVTNHDLKLKIRNSLNIGNFNIYRIDPNNCSFTNNSKYIDIFSSTIVEFTKSRDPFIWLNSVPTTINVQSFSDKTENINISFNLGPNPCNLPQMLKIRVNGKIQLFELGSKNSILQIPVLLSSNDFTQLVISTYDSNIECKVEEDKRNLVARIDTIVFSEK